jgi:hypothetical protein
MRRVGPGLGSLMALLAALIPASAQATFPGRNGAIFATFDDHNRPFIRAIDPNGAPPKVVFKCSHADCPDFIGGIGLSSDGKRAAFDGTTFTEPRVSETHVSILLIASRQVRQLPLLKGLESESDQDPAWFPHSSQLALAIRDPNGALGLFTAASDASVPKRLIRCDCGRSAVSPNGQLILFERGQDLWIAYSDGTRARRFARNAEQPSWSPGGGQVAFVSLAGGLNVVTARADGSHRRTLAVNATSPAWSPNGQLIAFDRCPKCTSNNMTSSIYTMRTDGSGLRRLYTDHPGTDIGFGQLDWQALAR